MSEAEDESRISRTALKIALIVVAIQAIVAAMVVIRARIIARTLAAKRPAEYPWRRFEPVPLFDGDEVAEAANGEALLFMRGTEWVDDIIAHIGTATSTIYLESFIWVDDACGRAIRDALADAAARGVDVYVMYDWLLSSKSLSRGFFPPSITVHAFRPVRVHPSAVHPRNLLRDHRKIVVIDHEVAWIGGYNIGEEYRDWRDTHVRVRGPLVGDLENVFVDFWNANRTSQEPSLEERAPRSWRQGGNVHRNDPGLAIFPIRGMYLEAIDRATDKVWITNAYFVPDRAFLRSLMQAARRGVDVRIILPRRSNHALTDALAHGMFETLMSAGIRIFLYENFMVHAKTATVDGLWSTIGTANLDRWSMLGNYEVNAEFFSPELARQMEAMFLLDLESCREVEADVWRRRPIRMRAAERTLKRLAPLL